MSTDFNLIPDTNDLALVIKKLEYYKKKFDRDFSAFFSALPKQLEQPAHCTFLALAIKFLKDLSLRGGKRQRVAFLYETYKLFDLPLIPALKNSAISIELLQSHLLIHDDLVDNSPLRRGGLTTYRQFQNFLKNKTLNKKYSLGLTIFTGDLTAYLALAVLLKNQLPAQTIQKLIEIQLEAGLNTFIGQIFDLERDLLNSLVDKDLFALADFKAVRSSVLAPMLMGLVLADQDSPRNRCRIARYAVQVGIAGQLQDDVLGLFGNQEVIGKSNTTDLGEGKRTLLIKYALERFTKKESEFFNQIFGNPNASIKDLEAIKKLIKETGAVERVKTIAVNYAQKAKAEAGRWRDWNQQSVSFFAGAADWFVYRKL